MQNLTAETPQFPKKGRTAKRHRLLIVFIVFLIVFLIGVAAYVVMWVNPPIPKPERWMNEVCFRTPSWNAFS